MKQVWIVDDDRSIRWVLEKALSRAGIASRSFSRADDVLAAFRAEVPLVLVSDIRMPGTSGVELLEEVQRSHPGLPVIIMTAYSDLESAVSSFRKGAYEYLPKPFDIDKAVGLIRRALAGSSRASGSDVPSFQGLVGQSPAMQDIFRAISRLSGSTEAVLVTGEAGTGKSVVAQALHANSPHSGGPFVSLNMSSMPRDLLEAELFGHEKGAFPGAVESHAGFIEQADGGTLFLNSIGGMPPETQAKLLRLLADGVFYRIGGRIPLRANVRLIASTGWDLAAEARSGRFSEDLLQRLSQIRLHIPALRERAGDIPLLAEHFLAAAAGRGAARQLDPEAMQFLASFRFPGNVRQLENLCRWLTVMAPAPVVRLRDLPADMVGGAEAAIGTGRGSGSDSGWLGALQQEVERRLGRQEPRLMDSLTRDFERVVLSAALQHTGGRKIEAAQRLGVGRNTVTRKIQELHLE